MEIFVPILLDVLNACSLYRIKSQNEENEGLLVKQEATFGPASL